MLFDRGTSYEEFHANVCNKFKISYPPSKLRFAQPCQPLTMGALATTKDLRNMLSLSDSFARVYIAIARHEAQNGASMQRNNR